MDLNIIVGGPQGGGIETAGLLAVRALAMAGLEVFADREYHSNIKGKHSYSHIRAADRHIESIRYPVDALGGLDAETIASHYQEVKPGGVLVYDSALAGKSITKIPSIDETKLERLRVEMAKNVIGDSVESLGEFCAKQGLQVAPVPFSRLIADALKGPSPLIERTMNTAVTTALLALAGVPKEAILRGIGAVFKGKPDVLELNLKVVEGVYGSVQGLVRLQRIVEKPLSERRLLLAGNDAVAIGKLLGGVRLQTYYPITPAADESFAIEENYELKDAQGNLIGSPIVIQTEDEISAIGMAIGGALTGTRSATSTSGPGFSLMIEALGWAGNNEVPVVITSYQRGGPATGLPTRHSQSDLHFAIFGGHGEFSRMVLASGDHREALADAVKSLNYAERYQVPVIHLLDKGLANCLTTMTVGNVFQIDRGKRYRSEPKPQSEAQGKDEGTIYRRFEFTEDGISPRAFLGEETMWYTGDEHNQLGNICEDPYNRNAMYDKRMSKGTKMLVEMPDEDKATLYGPEKYDDLILTWGTTKGAAVDALEEMGKMGRRVSILQVRLMEPFPADYVSRFLNDAGQVISVEGNYQGLLAELVRFRCGIVVKNRVVKFTGRLVSEDEVASAYGRILKGESRVVLVGGE